MKSKGVKIMVKWSQSDNDRIHDWMVMVTEASYKWNWLADFNECQEDLQTSGDKEEEKVTSFNSFFRY